MGREIKFRAWHNTKKETYVLESINFNRSGELDSVALDTGIAWNKVFGETEIVLMQFTGLKDKNGRDIYEGDIVKAELYRSYLMPHEHNPQVLEVAYEEDMTLSPFHTLVGYDGERWANVLVDGFEVIGNIHEHPELLKEA